MFNRKIKKFLILAVFSLFAFSSVSYAEGEDGLVNVNANSLPINVSGQDAPATPDVSHNENSLLSPSAAQAVSSENKAPAQDSVAQKEDSKVDESAKADDFNFDLKMKAINTPSIDVAPVITSSPLVNAQSIDNQSEELTAVAKEVSHQSNPADHLGNSILSQMDDDLFKQMSEIEKSTTLLTLELRREKLRNEIEAQKAIRRRSAEEQERQKREDKMRNLEREKEIEANVLREKQLLLDKEKVFEALKQRKLLNAYMNQMLLDKQAWLKEKEDLYAKLAAADKEKKELIELFKQKINKVLSASAQNIQTAEAAKANFVRVVKGLKARNEQLRKRIEADALIIKNSKNNLYQKAQSIEELKGKHPIMAGGIVQMVPADEDKEPEVTEKEESTEEIIEKLSAQYAILGITGRAGVMSVDVIDAQGLPLSLKIGSTLPTGHVVSEIGSDYVKFVRDGHDDYLYVGKTIDGVVPTLGLNKDKVN